MDSFVDNVTLGVAKFLEQSPLVESVTVVEKQGVDKEALYTWEQRHNCVLPADAKNLYLATDGLNLKWNLKTKDEPLPAGVLEISSLSKLRRITPKYNCMYSELPTFIDLESDSDVDEKSASNVNQDIPPKPKFKSKCKAFLLDPCQGNGRVCLVYPGKGEKLCQKSLFLGCLQQRHSPELAAPSVWFLDRALEWHYLSPDFASYIRLALVHLGIPHWQYIFTPWGPPPKTKQLLGAFVSERLAMNNMVQTTVGSLKSS